MEAVLNKTDFVRRFIAGEFGNRTPTWRPRGRWSVGCFRGFDAGFRTVYNVAPGTPRPPGCYVSAMVPKAVEALGLIQGEVQQTPPGSGRCGLDLYYSKLRLPMKESLNKGGVQTHESKLSCSSVGTSAPTVTRGYRRSSTSTRTTS